MRTQDCDQWCPDAKAPKIELGGDASQKYFIVIYTQFIYRFTAQL